MFSFPSRKAAPHKTINLLTISVTLHCPKYTKEKKKSTIPSLFFYFLPCHEAQMQENEKHPEWGAQERSSFLLPMYSARTEGKIFPNPPYMYPFSREILILGCKCPINACQIRLLAIASFIDVKNKTKQKKKKQFCWLQPQSLPRDGVQTSHEHTLICHSDQTQLSKSLTRFVAPNRLLPSTGNITKRLLS